MKLDENKVYSLEDLTSEEWELLKKHLPEKFNNTTLKEVTSDANKNLSYLNGTWWCNSSFPKGVKVNAKELFYTLKNVQVDCSKLSEEQIKEIANVFKKDGYEIGSLDLIEEYCFLRKNAGKYCLVGKKHDDKTTITYEKFMELFGKEKSQEFKNLVEVLNEELTEEAYKGTEYEVKYIAEKPKHYAKGIDTFARMEANCTTEECLAFAKGNIDKYNFRTKGQDLEDYKKIVSYANWAISLLNKA